MSYPPTQPITQTYPNNINIKHVMARTFTYLFLSLSLSLAGIAIYEFSMAFTADESLATGLVKSINIAVVSLAIYELGIGINKEYTTEEDEPDGNIYATVRRSITRFVAVVCVALVLEGLIMVIKYSQLELAGNLFYPVAIITSASMLLVSLGGFLRLTSDL